MKTRHKCLKTQNKPLPKSSTDKEMIKDIKKAISKEEVLESIRQELPAEMDQ